MLSSLHNYFLHRTGPHLRELSFDISSAHARISQRPGVRELPLFDASVSCWLRLAGTGLESFSYSEVGPASRRSGVASSILEAISCCSLLRVAKLSLKLFSEIRRNASAFLEEKERSGFDQ
jgi:hypothetical protein